MSDYTSSKFRYMNNPDAFEHVATKGMFVTVYYDAGTGEAARTYFINREVPYKGAYSGIVVNVDSNMMTLVEGEGNSRMVSFSRMEIIDVV